jgi:hypothetical protein
MKTNNHNVTKTEPNVDVDVNENEDEDENLNAIFSRNLDPQQQKIINSQKRQQVNTR